MTLQIQFLTLFSVIASGMIVSFFFDGYRVLKGKIVLRSWIIFFIDVLYGVAAGILIFTLLLWINNGQLRLTYYIFFLLGLWIYYKMLSLYFIKLWLMFYELIYQIWLFIITLIRYLLIKPTIIIYKLLISIIYLIVTLLSAFFYLLKRAIMPVIKFFYSPLKGKAIEAKRKIIQKEGFLAKIKKIFKR